MGGRGSGRLIEEYKGMDKLEEVIPDERKRMLDALCGEAELKQIFYRSKRRDGTYALLTTRAFVLSDSNGAPEYFGGIIIPQ